MELQETEKLKVNTFSNEVHDIIEEVPSWPIRYGIIYFSVFILVFFYFLHLIAYPDLIHCRITIISETPSIKIFTKAAGQIQLFKQDKEQIEKNEQLALILNTTDYEDLKWLVEKIPIYREQIKETQLDQLSGYIRTDLVLGELQLDYNVFVENINTYINFKKLKIPVKKIEAYDQQIESYKQLNDQLQNQLNLKKKEVAMLSKRLEQNRSLLQSQVISAVDFENFEIQFLEQQQSLEIIKNSLINNRLLIQQLSDQKVQTLVDSDKVLYEVNNALELSLNRLESRILAWKESYLITAPVSGRLNYLNFFDDNQFIEQGQAMFAISSYSGRVYAKGMVPAEGSGKIKAKQKTLISLDNYPPYEFGYIHGLVGKIGSIPENGYYTITFELPSGLSTNLDYDIPYSPELHGGIEIITNNQTVLERILGQIYQIFRHE